MLLLQKAEQKYNMQKEMTIEIFIKALLFGVQTSIFLEIQGGEEATKLMERIPI